MRDKNKFKTGKWVAIFGLGENYKVATLFIVSDDIPTAAATGGLLFFACARINSPLCAVLVFWNCDTHTTKVWLCKI